MNVTAFALLLGLCSLAGCSAPEHVAVSARALRFEQTPCFGPCAVFVLEVAETGEATLAIRKPFLEGALMHLQIGTYRGEVSDVLHSAVVRAAEQVKFETLDARYDNPRIMDLPSTKYSVGTHAVEQRYGGPDLSVLKAAFYELLETTVWTSVTPASDH